MRPAAKEVLRSIGRALQRSGVWWAAVIGTGAVLLSSDTISTWF